MVVVNGMFPKGLSTPMAGPMPSAKLPPSLEAQEAWESASQMGEISHDPEPLALLVLVKGKAPPPPLKG